MKVQVAAALLFSFMTVGSLAQAQEQESAREGRTYLKAGLTHTGSEIEGFSVVVNGLSFDLERSFAKERLGLSGWFIGYRKDDLRYGDFGHLVSGGTFRTFNLPAVDLKVGGGVEWGIISPNYSKTRQTYVNGEPVSYEHLFPHRNIDIPGFGPSHDSALYPFVEAGISRTWKAFLVEAGARGNIHKFGFDTYRLDGDNIEFIPSERTRVVPALFIKLGFAVGGNSAKRKAPKATS